MTLSRRSFITGAAAVAGMGLLAGCSPKTGDESLASTGDDSWDKEADLVVVGGGCGQFCAIAGALAGMSVILLEKSAMLGGAMALSGGNLWLANNEFSQATGDSYEKARTYLEQMNVDENGEVLIDAYLNNTQKVLDTMKEAGITLQPLENPNEYQQLWEGAHPEGGRSVQVFADEGQDTSAQGGARLGAATSKACEELGVDIMTKTSGDRLVTERDSSDGVPRVIGIVAKSDAGKEVRIKANCGVVLATGGFEWNEQLVKNYLPAPVHYALSLDGNVGDGLRMAQSVGAELRLMNEFFGQLCFKAHGEYSREHGTPMSIAGNFVRRAAGSIFVDSNGRRFCREDGDYNSLPRTFTGRRNFGDYGYTCDPAWWICDDACYQAIGGVNGPCIAYGYPIPDVPEEDFVFKADTLEELGEMIGINAAQLVKTVEEFNENADAGGDPIFHRGEIPFGRVPSDPATALRTPPFYAAGMAAGAVGTKGGPRLNENAQVMHVSGEPVQGLYAMGNCAGVGSPGNAYGGEGGSIGPAAVFGIIAANHAATRMASAE